MRKAAKIYNSSRRFKTDTLTVKLDVEAYLYNQQIFLDLVSKPATSEEDTAITSMD